MITLISFRDRNGGKVKKKSTKNQEKNAAFY